ncbi:hypothetical protein BT93_L5309 [Corymbia citriodora subsp. variegata]|uniref:non-specific serine/threonine protein kinase n=1 Tax=Corymbia citriodora subsp. variegata TaxID=360336 RepID=A0A8T0CSE1_CORYI|nr:hypothetical protein BT93_L5309 [Corymbia citriodora subsp. variegata]
MGNCCGSRKKEDKSEASLTTTSGGLKLTQSSFHSSTALSPSAQPQGEKCRPVSLPTPRSEGDILSSPHLKPFTYNELKNATRNFRNDSLIGEGGFGYVYKGWIDVQTLGPARPGCGMVVAIKKLKPEGFQGHKEWLAEVNYLGQLHHPNLVKLIGYCLDGDNRLLVYEYMPRGSLENHLFRRGAQPLSWAIRIKVAIGAARGLSFLHESEQQVIYRDFKASNILLDLEYNAKLSDFGLAKAGPTGDRTHVSTQVMGTQGYAAPEYIATGRLTARCDVYSFGVVLLELLSGRRAVDKTKVGVEQNLVDWAKPYLSDKRKLYRIMDVKLEGQYPHKGAFMAAFLAFECIGDAKRRPSMTEVLARLEKIPVPKELVAPVRQEQQFGSSSPGLKSPLQRNCPSPAVRTPRQSSPLITPRHPHSAMRSPRHQ